MKQVYITTRKEPFDDITNSFIPNLVYQSNSPRVGEICLLTPKQIMKAYTKLGLKKYKRKLKKYIGEQEHTIFEIPFFLQYADIILKATNQQNIIKEDAIFIIVEEWIKKEWHKYWTKYSYNYKGENKEYIYMEYVKLVYMCLYKFSYYLLIENEYEIPLETMEKVVANLGSNNMYDSIYYLLTRNLIHKVNDKYSFIHFTFYDFFIAKTLAENVPISYNIKKNILIGKKQIEKTYIFHLDNIVNSRKLLNYCLDEKEKKELRNLKSFNINYLYQQKKIDFTNYKINDLSLILKLFPRIEEIRFHQYYLNALQVDLIRYCDEVSYFLFKKGITSLKYIENFGKINVLDLYSMKINDEDIVYLSRIQIKILKFFINIQEKQILLKLKKIKGIKELHAVDRLKADVILYIYELWRTGEKIQFYIEGAEEISDDIYSDIKLDIDSKLHVLEKLYILIYKEILVESNDKYAYIDVGYYIVKLLANKKEIEKAIGLAEFLIAKEEDGVIRESSSYFHIVPIRIPNGIRRTRAYIKYTHVDLIFTLGKIYLERYDYNKVFHLFQRGFTDVNRVFGGGFASLRRGRIIGEDGRRHLEFLYGMSAALIGEYDISIQYLIVVAKGRNTMFYEYPAFCSYFFLAYCFWKMDDLESTNSWLQKCNTEFLYENLYYHQNYKVEIRFVLSDLINENLSTKKDMKILYISKILYGKILALMFQDFETSFKYFSEGINEMSNIYGKKSSEVMREEENIKLILNKELIWKDCE